MAATGSELTYWLSGGLTHFPSCPQRTLLRGWSRCSDQQSDLVPLLSKKPHLLLYSNTAAILRAAEPLCMCSFGVLGKKTCVFCSRASIPMFHKVSFLRDKQFQVFFKKLLVSYYRQNWVTSPLANIGIKLHYAPAIKLVTLV